MKILYTTGFAGTGKSTKLLELLHTLPQDTSIVLAPTHKALERLKDSPVELKTIHSLLGLIPRINENAETVNQLHTLHKLDKAIEQYQHIVIDEAGMINEEHFLTLVAKLEDLEEEHTNFNPTLHLYLDPYQLLPVKGYQLQTDPDTTTNLTTQYRSKSFDIVEAYTRFVDYLIGTNKDDLSISYSNNILPLDISKFKKGDRLLAYTNKKVGEWNQLIAKELGIKSYVGQEVQIGVNETTIVDKFVNPTYTQLLDAYYNKTLKLQNSKINQRFLSNALDAMLKNGDIQWIESGSALIPVIVGIGNAKTILKEAGKAAINNRRKFTTVYALGRAYIMDYPFATTVHKAQGSEFDTVFVDKEDIQQSIRNNYYDTYARMMYVSISRCKKTLYI